MPTEYNTQHHPACIDATHHLACWLLLDNQDCSYVPNLVDLHLGDLLLILFELMGKKTHSFLIWSYSVNYVYNN